MKTQLALVILTTLLVSNAFAANEDNNTENAQDSSTMKSSMMNNEQMMQMHKHMQEMQDVMAKIRREQDPATRQQLMMEHMQSMQEAMGMMGGAKMGVPGNSDMSSMGIEERMTMMQNQMGMMNMMMEQMMNHFSQDSSFHE